jgi:hypothetical protein
MDTIAARLRALADEVEALEAGVPPPPEPAPPEPPPPEPEPEPAPEPQPPAPEPEPQARPTFAAVELLSTNTKAPTQFPPDQRLILRLHGGGGWSAIESVGLQFKATGERFSHDPAHFVRFGVEQYGDALRFLPQAGAPGTGPDGDWIGWMVGDVCMPYHEWRLDALLAWADATYPNISRTKRSIGGNSLGGHGALHFGLRRPHQFAFAQAARCRWRYGAAGQVIVPQSDGTRLYVDPADAPEVYGFGATLAEYEDMVAYVANPANKIPFVAWYVGRQDHVTRFEDHIAAVDALRATKRGFQFAWNDEGHSTSIQLDVEPGWFELGVGYPVFSGSSRDQDPRVDAAGFINRGFRWRNLSESADAWACDIANVLGETTVTVDPHSDVFVHRVEPQTVTIPAGQWVRVEFTAPVNPPAPEPPPPEPEPEPEPEPPAPEPEDPPPEPPPVDGGDKPADLTRAMGAVRLCFDAWNPGDRYIRWEPLIVLKGVSAIKFNCQKAGGGAVPFSASEYTLLCDGQPVATVTPDKPSNATFTLDASAIAEGWHVFDIAGDPGETGVFWPMFVLHGDVAPPQQWMPRATGSYAHKGPALHRISWVPAADEPTTLALPPREFPHFSLAVDRAQLWREEVVPRRDGDLGRPMRHASGLLNTHGQQWYKWSDFIAKIPRLPLLDGPRGVGTMGYPTHVEIGRFVNPLTNVPGHMLYVMDPWRVCRIKPNGLVTTLVGWRHRRPMSHWGGDQDLELVGDWSAIPPERHGFHELWGMCWDPVSLQVDEAAEPIPEERDLKPHAGAGPTMFVADSQNNRVCKVVFGGAASSQGQAARHDVPPVVTEFLTGLADPWDVVEWRGSLIVSERTAHRICEYSMQTGELVRVILQGPPLANVNRNRFVERLASVAVIQGEPVVAPEGLYVIDDWLYFGSVAMQQVRRVHLIDGTLEVVVPNYANSKSNYIKIAVSDGTAGPKGTVFVTSWTNSHFGAPVVFRPDGTGWSVTRSTSKSISRGRGGDGDGIGYNAAVAARDGRIVYGGADEGLISLSLALPGDPACDVAKFNAGRNEYRDKGYQLTHGHNGMGFYGLPLPWGESEAIDYFLRWYGHH